MSSLSDFTARPSIHFAMHMRDQIHQIDCRPWVKTYGLAVVLAGADTLLRWLFQSVLDGTQAYIFIHPAVLLAGMYGGFGPGLFCLLLSFAASVYLFDPPVGTFTAADVVGAVGSFLVAMLILVAAVMQRRARLAAMRAHATQITLDKQIKAVNYSIETVNGTVYVMGIAQNQAEVDRIRNHARQLTYVRRIVNYVRIKDSKAGTG